MIGGIDPPQISGLRVMTQTPRNTGGTQALAAIRSKLEQGDFTAAIAACREYLAKASDSAPAWALLADALAATGDVGEAGKSLSRAIQCDGSVPGYHVRMGDLFARIGRAKEASACFGRALALDATHLPALLGQANATWAAGDLVQARALWQQVLAARPDDAFAARNVRLLNGQLVERWHFPMVSDGPRNRDYERALKKAINADSVVLDIGAGTGLLSMMAARAGAARVIACEAKPVLAELAGEIVAANGHAERVRVLAKPSYQIDPARDFPDGVRPNLIVAEIFDATVIGEGALPTFAHALSQLAAPGAQVIPARATLYGVLIQSDSVWREGAADTASGFDLRALNRYRPDCVGIEANSFEGIALSDDFAIFDFDFTRTDATSARKARLHVPVTRAGVCHGVLYWIKLHLDDELTLDNRPDLGAGRSDAYCAHWHQMVRLLIPALEVKPGMSLQIDAQHDRHAVALLVHDPATGECAL